MKIEMVKHEENDWFVRCGPFSADRLCLDEALATVASLMFTGRGLYLRTDFQNYLWNERYGNLPKLLPERASCSA